MEQAEIDLLVAAAKLGLVRPRTAEIARLAGVSETTVANVFIGRRGPGVDRVRAVLGLTTSEVVAPSSSPAEGDA